MERFQVDLGGRPLVIETGHVAKQAGGAVLVRYGETVVLVTATMSPQPREGIDFFPLTVDYEERLYAVGRIPGGFVKREGRPSEKAILAARLTDRPIRPLFPEGFRNDVHIVATILSVDQDNPPELAVMIGASTALSISSIPFGGPIGVVAVGYVDGQYVLNPVREQAERNRLNLVVAGTERAVLMVEAGAREIPEDVLLGAIAFGHERVKEIVRFQQGIVSAVGKPKQEVPLYQVDGALEATVREFAADRLAAAVMNPEKLEREALIDEIQRATLDRLGEAAVDKENDVRAVTQKILREVVRRFVLAEGRRPDGRTPAEIRTITCEVGVLPRTHGSALFTRGQTQVLTVATLGAVGDVQLLDGLTDEEFKRFMHHYNFPPYSVGETRPIRGPGRREIGHGALAERAIGPMLPDENEFPYTIRLVSEVLESNGSTSMASVCGSTLALMDAGIPIKAPVAGIAMGLVDEGNKAVILTDIQGIEDALGDMDFKVAGTTRGVTALQMDIKMEGISADLLARVLAQAREARLFVLREMLEVLPEPRKELSPYAPRMIIVEIDPEKIRDVIGPGGKTINKIIGETDAKIDIEQDGRVYITAVDLDSAERAMKMIQQLTKDVEVGEVYTGRVVRMMSFGAFVEILPGKEGLVHISQLGEGRVNRVEDVVKIGDEILVKVTEIDRQGRINLSRREAIRQERQPAREPRFNARSGRRRRGR